MRADGIILENLLNLVERKGANRNFLLFAERDRRQVEGGASYHRREIESGSFSRAIALPVKVDAEHVGARLANGVLTITLFKASAVTPRQIKVSAE